MATASRAPDRSCAAQRTARRRRRDRMGHAPPRPLHSRPVHFADDLRHLLYGAAGRLAAAKAENQLRADPWPRHHAKSRRKAACRRGGTGQPGRFLDHRRAGRRRARARHSRRSGNGARRPRIRQRHRRARLPAGRRGRRRNRGRQRGGARLCRAPPQFAHQHRDARAAGGAQRRADPDREIDGPAADLLCRRRRARADARTRIRVAGEGPAACAHPRRAGEQPALGARLGNGGRDHPRLWRDAASRMGRAPDRRALHSRRLWLADLDARLRPGGPRTVQEAPRTRRGARRLILNRPLSAPRRRHSRRHRRPFAPLR
eukprot:Opistho-1_new@83668